MVEFNHGRTGLWVERHNALRQYVPGHIQDIVFDNGWRLYIRRDGLTRQHTSDNTYTTTRLFVALNDAEGLPYLDECLDCFIQMLAGVGCTYLSPYSSFPFRYNWE